MSSRKRKAKSSVTLPDHQPTPTNRTPKGYGGQAEINRRATTEPNEAGIDESYELARLQEKSGMIGMLNEPEEDIWNDPCGRSI